MRRCLWLLAACASDVEPRPEPLAALPPPVSVDTDRFRDANGCAQCHLVPDGARPLHDAAGRNVSPSLLWRSSLMAMAARDPYYLAVVAEERARADDPDEVDALCTRCHAPAGSEERADRGGHLSFDDLVAGSDAAATIGREGVTCTLCHQIQPAGLGEDRSFSGGFVVDYRRELFGRYPNPVTSPMQLIVDFTPVAGSQIAESALCGTCHTVIVPGPAGDVVEQATYLEWRNSRFAADGRSCQSCHVPTVDEQGDSITVLAVAGTPDTLGPRSPFGRHTFVGGNSYLLRLLADATEWSGAGVSADELLASAERDDRHLGEAARLSLVERDATGFAIRVTNLTGHKLPTGYPSRKIWLHVRVEAGGATVFESGGTLPPDDLSHLDIVTSGDQVQVWEAKLVDGNGAITHRALDASRYGKDNRILPEGFAPSGVDRVRTLSAGAEADASFVAGSDDVRFEPPGGVPADARIHVELMYAALSPAIVNAIDQGRTSAGSRFVDLARARPITPVVMATLDQ
jgi:hypothetical protein